MATVAASAAPSAGDPLTSGAAGTPSGHQRRTPRRAPDNLAARLSDPYVLVSVLAVPPPAGASGTSWHRYEIRQGLNNIVGYRQGAAANVQRAIEALVVQLNERRLY